MKKFLLEFLKILEVKIPPPEHCHHCITYSKYGVGDVWKDQLSLQVNTGDFQCFFLDDSDFDLTPDELAEFIAQAIRDGAPPGTQFGIGPGQYVK